MDKLIWVNLARNKMLTNALRSISTWRTLIVAILKVINSALLFGELIPLRSLSPNVIVGEVYAGVLPATLVMIDLHLLNTLVCYAFF